MTVEVALPYTLMRGGVTGLNTVLILPLKTLAKIVRGHQA